MKSQLPAVMERTPEPELAQHSSEKISKQFSQISDGIARRAFDIFESRGRSPGHELEDWFRAESELLGARLPGSQLSDRDCRNDSRRERRH